MASMSTEAQDKAILNELVAIRLFGLELHVTTTVEPAEPAPLEAEEEGSAVVDPAPALVAGGQDKRIATISEAEDAWRKLGEGDREHWRSLAHRLLPQLEEDGVTVRARAEAGKTLRIALTVPAHAVYEIPGLRK